MCVSLDLRSSSSHPTRINTGNVNICSVSPGISGPGLGETSNTLTLLHWPLKLLSFYPPASSGTDNIGTFSVYL